MKSSEGEAMSKDPTQVVLRDQIARLDDSSATDEAKKEAVRALAGAGVASIGLLVERLAKDGDAVCFERAPIATGPMNPGPTKISAVTVKFIVEELLYQIIAPSDPVASAAATKTGALGALEAQWAADRAALDGEAPSRPPIAFVDDWSTWWTAHRGEDLDVLRAWSRDEIDRRWALSHEETSLPPR